MPLSVSRISKDIEAIAAFSEKPVAEGHSRPTFSGPWRQACEYIRAQARAIGCQAKTDAAGNIHIRPGSLPWTTPAWLSGSHIDSVPSGGKYDGVAGIVAPLEILRSAHESNQTVPLELIIFAEEEGTTFGLGMIGSRLWTDAATALEISAFKNRSGQNFFQAGAAHGVNAAGLAGDRFNRDRYLGFIEIHIEQGPAMWANHQPIAIVTAIAGRKQYKGQFVGVSNHAGSTPMNFRRDALVSAARLIVEVDSLAREYPGTVATVGKLEVEPNAINVIPGAAYFTVDLRSPDEQILLKCDERLKNGIAAIGGQYSFAMTEDQPPILMDRDLCSRLSSAAGNPPHTISGALHDSAILAPHLPTAMIFVASKDGISHNPAEFSRVEDIAAAASALYEAIR